MEPMERAQIPYGQALPGRSPARHRPLRSSRATRRHAEPHRDVKGGGARAAILGGNDGLVSNVALIVGIAGAHPAATAVRLAGLAGMVAGACSMAVGEYVSMRGQKELFERELRVERRELERAPRPERKELERIYRDRGVSSDVAAEVAGQLMDDPDSALDAHARDELGLDPDDLGSPWQAATSSFVSFAAGAVVPLLAWFFLTGLAAVVASVGLAAIASAGIGTFLGFEAERSPLRSAARQVLLMLAAAGITYGVGRALGASGAV